MEPPLKRRRLSGPRSSVSVNKPFRSPLKQIDSKAQLPSSANTSQSIKAEKSPVKSLTSSSTAPKPFLSSKSSTTASGKPTLRQLEALILSARRTNETLSHALALLSDPEKDLELQELTRKWRAAARMAAEEAFGYARDKVNSMGGMAAWKARQREMEEQRRWGWGEDAQRKDEDDEAEREQEVELEEEDEEEFTMDTMLKSMGIGLDVIGFDKEKSIWVVESSEK